MRIAQSSLSLSGVKISTTPVSMGATFSLDAIFVAHAVNFAIQLVFTGTPGGTLTLEASNDLGTEDKGNGNFNSTGVTHWTTVLNSDQAVTTAGDHMWNVENCGYRWVRVTYTRTSSTGSLTVATLHTKGI